MERKRRMEELVMLRNGWKERGNEDNFTVVNLVEGSEKE